MVLALTCKLYITFNEPYFVKFEVDDVILLFLAYKSLKAVFSKCVFSPTLSAESPLLYNLPTPNFTDLFLAIV